MPIADGSIVLFLVTNALMLLACTRTGICVSAWSLLASCCCSHLKRSACFVPPSFRIVWHRSNDARFRFLTPPLASFPVRPQARSKLCSNATVPPCVHNIAQIKRGSPSLPFLHSPQARSKLRSTQTFNRLIPSALPFLHSPAGAQQAAQQRHRGQVPGGELQERQRGVPGAAQQVRAALSSVAFLAVHLLLDCFAVWSRSKECQAQLGRRASTAVSAALLLFRCRHVR